MSKRAGLSARKRALLVSTVMVLGAIASVPAFAVPPPPSATIKSDQVVADAYLNRAEWNLSGITVEGTYDTAATPPITHIAIRVVNDAGCSAGAAETTDNVEIPAMGGTFSHTFTPAQLNAAGAPATANDANQADDLFSEGAKLCARVLASDDNGDTYGTRIFSNVVTKDTTPPARGSIELLDPNTDGYMNIAEGTSNAIGIQWVGDADAVKAQYTFTQGGVQVAGTNCGVFTNQPASGSSTISPACATDIVQTNIAGDPFEVRADWFDAASNQSDAPDCVSDPTVACDTLIKDMVAPIAPTLDVSDPINVANVTQVKMCGTAEDAATVNLSIQSGTASASGTTEANQPGTTCDIAANYTALIDATGIPDGNTVTGSASATDLAGNTGPTTTTPNFVKDATPPAKPFVQLFPEHITAANQANVELTVGGEAGMVAHYTIRDHTGVGPVTGMFTLTSDVTKFLNLSGLADGPIVAEVFLTDGVGNESPVAIVNATKDAYKPLVQILSPATDSLYPGAVSFQGTASAGVCGGLGQVEVVEGNVSLGKAAIASNCTWKLDKAFTSSGTHIVKARAVRDSSGTTLGFKPLDPGGPSEYTLDRRFDVDAIRPTTTTSTSSASVYMSGDPVVIRGAAQDDFSGLVAVEYHIYDIKGVSIRNNQPVLGRELDPTPKNAPCTGCLIKWRRTATWELDLSNLPSGQYYVQFFAIDYAQNRQQEPTVVTFVKL